MLGYGVVTLFLGFIIFFTINMGIYQFIKSEEKRYEDSKIKYKLEALRRGIGDEFSTIRLYAIR
jgi:Na+-transporting methylmalonyl-CoA/oxaloacetate decarboxylase gamma subunit